MTTTNRTVITVETTVHAPVKKVWKFWTSPAHIIKWNNASPEWHTPRAENDLRVGGRFLSRMEARDGSMGFDFEGTYDVVDHLKMIDYTMDDGRKVSITFEPKGNDTKVVESFEAEDENPIEMQRGGWQAILDNFKKHAEETPETSKIKFDLVIGAPVSKVYSSMIDDKSYREWTAIFNGTSHYKGSWEKGSKILFIGVGEDGSVGGMVSRIKENIPNKFISIEHLGVVKGEDEITSGPEVDDWAGMLENYSFSEHKGGTKVDVEMDSNEEFESYFNDTWPKALEKLKEICER